MSLDAFVRGYPAGPGQAIVLAVAGTTFGFQDRGVESMPVALMRLDSFRAVSRVADRPGATIEFMRNIFDYRLIILYLNVLA